MLKSRDPDGTFASVPWETEQFPRIGEDVMLPDGTEHWQEMVVEAIEHGRLATNVWVGGSDGWDPGSVRYLFDQASRWRAANGPPG